MQLKYHLFHKAFPFYIPHKCLLRIIIALRTQLYFTFNWHLFSCITGLNC